MTGDRILIELRRVGVNPVGVWVTDSDDHYSRVTAREALEHRRQFAHLRIEQNDIPDALDLRCVVGLTCHVASDRNVTRFNRIFDALVAAGARAVVGVHNGEIRHHIPQLETVHG